MQHEHVSHFAIHALTLTVSILRPVQSMMSLADSVVFSLLAVQFVALQLASLITWLCAWARAETSLSKQQ